MAQTAFPLPPAGAAGTNLYSIDPQKNWRRYPSVPITKAMTDPAYIPAIANTVAVASLGATSDNDGEVGTPSVAYNADAPYADTGVFAPMSQKERAGQANLTPGTIIAPDVGISYHGTRGAVAPTQPYPQTVAPTTVTPDAFLPAGYIAP
jgi:hypothetical protein